jgi:hypothetical protein
MGNTFISIWITAVADTTLPLLISMFDLTVI